MGDDWWFADWVEQDLDAAQQEIDAFEADQHGAKRPGNPCAEVSGGSYAHAQYGTAIHESMMKLNALEADKIEKIVTAGPNGTVRVTTVKPQANPCLKVAGCVMENAHAGFCHTVPSFARQPLTGHQANLRVARTMRHWSVREPDHVPDHPTAPLCDTRDLDYNDWADIAKMWRERHPDVVFGFARAVSDEALSFATHLNNMYSLKQFGQPLYVNDRWLDGSACLSYMESVNADPDKVIFAVGFEQARPTPICQPHVKSAMILWT